jgi:membrane protein required for colicin V production
VPPTDEIDSLNWVDLTVLVVVGISAALAFMRGFVREVLGIAAWAGAAWISYSFVDLIRAPVHDLIGDPNMAEIVAYAALFLAALLVLTIITGVVAQVFHALGLGAVDRTLGIVFGLARGAALTVAAYIGAGWVMPPERWPEPVRQARLLPLVSDAAGWTAEQIPPRFRPSVPLAPGFVPPTRSIDLLQAIPLGRQPNP